MIVCISVVFFITGCSRHLNTTEHHTDKVEQAIIKQHTGGIPPAEKTTLLNNTPPSETTPLQLTTQLADHAKASRPIDPLLVGISAQDIAMAKAQTKRNFHHSWKTIALRSRFVRHRLLLALQDAHAPTSLQIIPVIESAYNPYALSEAGALGLWQLMPRTAKHLGVQSNKAINGRRNINASTKAAVHYLQTMHQRFNSWPLAIAAYNLGPYAVERRLKKHPWNISDGLENMPIPTMTRAYVQHAIGLIALLQDNTFSFPTPITTQALELQAPIDIQQLEHVSGMGKNEIFRFNPCLNQAQYLYDTITIHIPTKQYAQMQASTSRASIVYLKEKIHEGDNLWDIARKHHTSVRRLKMINPSMGKYLHVGQLIKIPANKLAQAHPDHNPLLIRGRHIRYKVRNGDSLWIIAKRFGTTPRAIARSNQISMRRIIHTGDILWVLANVRPS